MGCGSEIPKPSEKPKIPILLILILNETKAVTLSLRFTAITRRRNRWRNLQLKTEKKHTFFTHIMDTRISESLEKPLKLNSYTVKGDLDDHVQHVDDRLNFYHTDDVDSSTILCENITTLFISRKRQATTITSLKGITLSKKESLKNMTFLLN